MSRAKAKPAPSGTPTPAAPAAPRSCILTIKAIPNAPRSEVVGWLGDALKIKVHAPPVEGRANDALCEFLADTLGLSRRAVTVLRGDTSRQKTLRIEGLTFAEARTRLGL
ncbi:MAG: DUF167 domain-containing protein [Verrucomicrobiota bacterium]